MPTFQIASCAVQRDPKTQMSRGFAFVKFKTQEAAESAIRDLDGQVIDGRPMTVAKVDSTSKLDNLSCPIQYFRPVAMAHDLQLQANTWASEDLLRETSGWFPAHSTFHHSMTSFP